MDPEQFKELINALMAVAGSGTHGRYTLTGAEDWPILAYVSTGFFAMMAVMWGDLKGTIRQESQDLKEEVDREAAERTRQDSLLWAALQDCKNDCQYDRRVGDRRSREP